MGFSDGLTHKESACNAGDSGDAGSVPGSGRSPGEGNGNLLQRSCLENPIDRGAWWAKVQRVTKRQTRLTTQAPKPHIFKVYNLINFDICIHYAIITTIKW